MWKITCCTMKTFHTDVHCYAKLGKIMKKVMGQSSKKKRIFSDAGILPNAGMFSKGSFDGRYSGSARRISVLNKLFMKYITDLLATGEYSAEFTGRGIEINRVQVSPDYNGLNVFWTAKGLDDEPTEQLLKKNAGFLRHELSSLRVIGNVPKIYFVKDKQQSQIAEVDFRLCKADFGEDHVSTEMATKLKTQLELYTDLRFEIREQIEKIETEEADDVIIDVLPAMPQNVLGLNYADILNKIKRSMKKSQGLHRVNYDLVVTSQYVNESPIEFSSGKERREAFKIFLEKRELSLSKARKLEEKYHPDVEYMRQEFEERQVEHLEKLEIYSDEDDCLK